MVTDWGGKRAQVRTMYGNVYVGTVVDTDVKNRQVYLIRARRCRDLSDETGEGPEFEAFLSNVMSIQLLPSSGS
jgi:hypothetical protein